MTAIISSIASKSSCDFTGRLKLVRNIFLIYVLIILLILSCALLNVVYPHVMGRILRDEVGLVAFICFVSIQGNLELEDDANKDASQFYFKLAVYIIDLSLCINARVRPTLVIFGCIFALVQLGFLYLTLLYSNTEKKTKKDSQFAGMFLILANVLALVFVMAKDFLPSNFVADTVKGI